MRMRIRQFDLKQRSVNSGPSVVLGDYKNRDGPLIYHRCDGPLFVTGPPCGGVPPVGTGPPYDDGPPGRTGPRHETGPPNGHGPPFKKEQAGVDIDSTKAKEKNQNINLIREETKMKNFKLKRLLSLAFVGCISALHAQSVFAAAGDDITNTATLNFDVGATSTSVDSNTVSFKEDRLLNFTVVQQDGASVGVVPNSSGQVLTFEVTNLGNGPQDFSLSAIESAGGADPFVPANSDAFDVTSYSIFVDVNNNDTYESATDTATFIDELPALGAGDNTRSVFIVSTIPLVTLPLADDDLAVMTLEAQVAVGGTATAQGADITTDDSASADNATEQTVFGDAAGDTDGVKDGIHSDTSSYIVTTSNLALSKTSAVLWDPVNLAVNPKAITGAYVTYTIVISNTGASASGDLTSMVDTLIANLALDDQFVTNAGPGNPANGANNSFEITHGGGSTRSSPVVCQGLLLADGCTYVPGTRVITIDFNTVMPAEDIAPAGAGAEDYAAGELKPDETVTIKFNAIVQ